MLDYKHWSFFLKGNKPRDLAVRETEHNVLQNKTPLSFHAPHQGFGSEKEKNKLTMDLKYTFEVESKFISLSR